MGGIAMGDNTPDVQAEIDAIVRFFDAARSQGDQHFVRQQNALQPSRLFSTKRLQQLLSNPLLSPDWYQVAVNGDPLNMAEDALWKTVQMKQLIFTDKSRLNALIQKGASVVLEGLDVLDFNINELLTQLDIRMPCALSNCEAFFSQMNNEAYSGHRDSDDVLVVQIEGRKRWRVYAPQQRRYIGNSPLDEIEMGPVVADFLMQRGDLLFLKAGVPHKCFTVGDYSLHLSIDLIDRTPNIEKITNLGNEFHNRAAALPHILAKDVVSHYIQHLTSDSFMKNLAAFESHTRDQAREFRRRISKSSYIEALKKYLPQ